MRYLIVAFALAAAGCATQKQSVWVKDGANAQDFNADIGQCRAQAFSVPGAMNNLMQVAVVQNQCMFGKGWTLEETGADRGHMESPESYRVIQ